MQRGHLSEKRCFQIRSGRASVDCIEKRMKHGSCATHDECKSQKELMVKISCRDVDGVSRNAAVPDKDEESLRD